MRKEIVLPFTCESRDKALWIYALILSPIIGSYGIFIATEEPTALCVFCLVGGWSTFIAGVAIKLTQLDMQEILPTFRCKCDDT